MVNEKLFGHNQVPFFRDLRFADDFLPFFFDDFFCSLHCAQESKVFSVCPQKHDASIVRLAFARRTKGISYNLL